MAYMNFTICMPNSATTSSDAGGGLFMSGVVIGCYGFGGFLGLPLFMRLSNTSYRSAFILQGVITLISNGFFAWGIMADWNMWWLVLARTVCGMEAGADLVCCVAIATCTVQRYRTRANALYNAAISVGLVMGPLLCSLTLQFGAPLFPSISPEALPILATMVLSVLFLVFVILRMPHQEELFEMAGLTNVCPPDEHVENIVP